MINTILNKILLLIGILYRKIFHEEISSDIEKFILNLSYVGFGTIIASAFTFPYNILAGRLLGPSEYGLFTLVQSVAMFLYIPMLLGFHTAMVKYNAEKIDISRQRSIISTTYILVFLFTIASLVVYFVFAKEIMSIFSISNEIFYFAIFFAVLFVFYTLTTEAVRSLHMIRTYSRLKPLFSSLLLFSFLVIFYLFSESSFRSPLFSMLLAYGVTGGIVLALLRKYLRAEFSREWAFTLHRYSIYSLMGGISAVLYLNIGKIIINMYMPISNVGIYWAYNYSFTTIIVLLSSIFVTVFFPVASMCVDKGMLLRRVNKIVILFILLGWPFVVVTGSIILKLYGESYPFDLSLTLLFATAGICIVVDGLYGQLFNSVGVNGARITSYAAVVLALVNVGLTFLLVPSIGLIGAIIAVIIGYLSSICIMLLRRDKLKSSI